MRAALVAGVVQDHRERDAQVKRSEGSQELTDCRGGNGGIVSDDEEFMGDRVEGASDVEALPARWGALKKPSD